MGIAVPSLGPAEAMLSALFGYRRVSGPFDDPLQQVRVCFLAKGAGDVAEIELIEPTSEDSPVQSMVTNNKGGAYHLCFETEDIEAALRHAMEHGCVVVSQPTPAVAFQGRRIAWIYAPSRQLFELVEAGGAV
jgi:methylmalonyl-CoA/ethylmalonyl-CoA epimerase